MNPGRKRLIAVGVVAFVAWLTYYFTVLRFHQVTPLMAAARAGDARLVARELAEGANPNRAWNEGGLRFHGTPRKGVTPLLFALERFTQMTDSRAQVVDLLLEAGADPCAVEIPHGSALVLAVEKHSVEVIRNLWRHDTSGCLKEWSGKAMLAAYYELSLLPEDPAVWEMVDFLLAEVAQPGEADHLATLVSSPAPATQAAIGKLLERGVKADGKALVRASLLGKTDLVPLLLAHGANVNALIPGELNEPDGPPLVSAAINPDPDGMRALLDAGADPNARDEDGRTALSRTLCESYCSTRVNAICERQLATVRLLLERGARIEGGDGSGRRDVATCVRERRDDPYRGDLETLLGLKEAD